MGSVKTALVQLYTTCSHFC